MSTTRPMSRPNPNRNPNRPWPPIEIPVKHLIAAAYYCHTGGPHAAELSGYSYQTLKTIVSNLRVEFDRRGHHCPDKISLARVLETTRGTAWVSRPMLKLGWPESSRTRRA